MNARGPVLITGATSSLGQMIVDAFAKRHVPLRLALHKTRPPELLSKWTRAGHELVDFDLLDKRCIERAVREASAVIHSAAPNSEKFGLRDLARFANDTVFEATKSLFEAGYAAGTRNFVFTSSCSAVGLRAPMDRSLNADDWNTNLHHPLLVAKSKAEEWCRDWSLAHSDVTMDRLCLPWLLGPSLYTRSSAHMLIKRALSGQSTTLPRISFHILDTRVAGEAHYQAWRRQCELGAGSGQRWIVAGPYLTSAELLNLLKDFLPPKNRVFGPAPDSLFKMVTLFEEAVSSIRRLDADFGMKGLKDMLGCDQRVDSRLADQTFHLRHPTARVSLAATVESMKKAPSPSIQEAEL